VHHIVYHNQGIGGKPPQQTGKNAMKIKYLPCLGMADSESVVTHDCYNEISYLAISRASLCASFCAAAQGTEKGAL
jgi:hypothetical protein